MQRRTIEIHDPMKNEIEETCQLRKMMQVSMMSVFLGLGYNTWNEEREGVCIPKHIHFTFCRLVPVPSVVHVDTVVAVVVVV